MGIGHWALGIGHWALGIGHWAYLITLEPKLGHGSAHWCQLNVKPSQRLLFDY
ncbi:MAG: hypothetical protein QQW96_12185 [Tychonema bourrellyi B0820]|nr:hypothetical protein [Tychonema bourrellyi B0820]